MIPLVVTLVTPHLRGSRSVIPLGCAVTAVTGSGSTTRIMILATSGPPLAGSRIVHRCNFPATAEITVEWRNATSGGTLITSALTDGSGDDAVAEFYFDGAAWQFLKYTSPANA